VRTRISSGSGRSGRSWDFVGDALPEGMALELGDGYRFETSMVTGEEGSDGDLDRTERGDEGGEEGGEEGGDEGGCCKESISGG